MILSDNLKRACIYCIYDRDGVIDDYIIYQLNDLRKNIAFLHCVINGRLTPDGRRKLEAIADEVWVRENKGLDIIAHKKAIEHIGWDELEKYDELVLANDTCFGPIYPFKECFDWAKERDLDFWGLTWGSKADWLGTREYLHYNDAEIHVQSYFIAVRKPLMGGGGGLFREFIGEIPDNILYSQAGSYFEYAFPGYFEDRGYKGDVYCENTDDLNYPLLHNPIRLLRDKRMPIFKKRSFFHHYTDVLNNTLGEAAVELLKFLKEETNYDTDLIWKSVIRTRALSDLVRCAQLNRVLPRNFLTNKVTMSEQKVGLVFHMYYENLFDENISFVLNFPSNADIFITTNSDAKKNAIKNKLAKIGREANIITIENRGCDVSSLLVGATDFVFNYDLICFMHDKKPSHVSPPSVDRSWSYKLNENMVATKEFVANVIDLFAREKWLGMAFPTAPNHSMYSSYIGDGWSGNYQNTERLLKDFGINVKINEHSLCVAPLGTCFWFRPITLKKLYMGYNGKGWSYRDFPREPNQTEQTILHAIERAYAYFAQDAGYYPVYLYNDKFTEIELTNLEFCKVGSQDMRNWMDLLVLNALGYMPNTNEPTVQITECTPPDGLTAYRQITINYGVRHALKMLAIALRIKFPHMWGALLPFRRMAKLMLRVE